MMNEEQFKQLIKKYLDDTATIEEREAVDAFLDSYDLGNGEWPVDLMGEPQLVENEILQNIRTRRNIVAPVKKNIRLRMVWQVAASLLLMFSIGYGVLYYTQPKTTVAVIKPGGNKAILTLADGRTIVLDNAQNGTLATQGNTAVTKQNNIIVYDASASDNKGVVHTNTISTPRGGQFEIVLPDGSKAWLNAASSIKFPTVFNGTERKVEITGEVYFEVAKVMAYDKISHKKTRMPFIACTKGMEVRVLGTHFDINAYNDENNLKATLLEGKVVVSPSSNGLSAAQVLRQTVILKPGQQSRLSGTNNITVNEVDIDEVLAWQKGQFIFNDTRMETIMNSIARWYNVDVKYEGDVRELKFGGVVSRKANVTALLDLLSLTGSVHFDIQGHTIIVKSGGKTAN